MNHKEAMEQGAVEKYLLDELPPPLRDEFEEHYFDCRECALDLRATQAFFDASKRELARAAPTRANAPPPRKPWLSFLLRPAFFSPAIASLLLIIGYQNLVQFPRGAPDIVSSVGPEILPSLSLVGGNSRGAGTPTVAVGAASAILVAVDIPANARFVRYSGSLRSASGATIWTLPISAQLANDTVSIRVPVAQSPAGSYSFVIQGFESTAPVAPATELAHYRFTLEKQD